MKYFNLGKDVKRVWLLGDFHVGHRGCDEVALKNKVNELVKSGDKWVGMGDHIDAIGTNDPRFSSSEMAPWIEDVDNIVVEQIDTACQILAPIASQCLGMLEGNHESKISKRDHVDVHSILCNRLGVQNLGYTCWATIGGYDAYLTHGFGGGRTFGGKANRVSGLLSGNMCDLAAMGHVHTTGIVTNAVRTRKGRKISFRQQVGVISGTFLQAAGYAENMGYSGVSNKQVFVSFKDGITVEIK